jgi:hypothetical protein
MKLAAAIQQKIWGRRLDRLLLLLLRCPSRRDQQKPDASHSDCKLHDPFSHQH